MKLLWFNSSIPPLIIMKPFLQGFVQDFTVPVSLANITLAKNLDCEQYFNTQWLRTRSHNQQNFSADKIITRGKTNYKQAYLHHTEFQDVSSGLQIFIATQDIYRTFISPVYHLIQETEHQLSFPRHLQNISITSIYQLICASHHRVVFSPESEFTAKRHWPKPCIINQKPQTKVVLQTLCWNPGWTSPSS